MVLYGYDYRIDGGVEAVVLYDKEGSKESLYGITNDSELWVQKELSQVRERERERESDGRKEI